MYKMMDKDGCGWVTWDEVREFYGSGIPQRLKDARLNILIYLDMLSNQNGGMSEKDWLTGLEKFKQWKQDFYYNFDEIFFLLDYDFDGFIDRSELENVQEVMCDHWKDKAGITN